MGRKRGKSIHGAEAAGEALEEEWGGRSSSSLSRSSVELKERIKKRGKGELLYLEVWESMGEPLGASGVFVTHKRKKAK